MPLEVQQALLPGCKGQVGTVLRKHTTNVSQILICGDVRTEAELSKLRAAGRHVYEFTKKLAKRFLPHGYAGVVPWAYDPARPVNDARVLANAINEGNGSCNKDGEKLAEGDGPVVRLSTPWLLMRKTLPAEVGSEVCTYYGPGKRNAALRAAMGYEFVPQNTTGGTYDSLCAKEELTPGELQGVRDAYKWMLANTTPLAGGDRDEDAAFLFAADVSSHVSDAVKDLVPQEHVPTFNVLHAAIKLLTADVPEIVEYGKLDELTEDPPGLTTHASKDLFKKLAELVAVEDVDEIGQKLLQLCVEDVMRGVPYGNWIAMKMKDAPIPAIKRVPFLQEVLKKCAQALKDSGSSRTATSMQWIAYRHACGALVCAVGLHLEAPRLDHFSTDKNGALLKGEKSGRV